MRSVCLVVGHGVHREALTATLVEAGFTVGTVLAGGGGTLALIREMAADVLLIDVSSFGGRTAGYPSPTNSTRDVRQGTRASPRCFR